MWVYIRRDMRTGEGASYDIPDTVNLALCDAAMQEVGCGGGCSDGGGGGGAGIGVSGDAEIL